MQLHVLTVQLKFTEVHLQQSSNMEIQALTANQLGLNTSVWTIMFFSAYKRSDVINLTCELYTASVIVANNTYNNVFTIPSGLRPKINI